MSRIALTLLLCLAWPLFVRADAKEDFEAIFGAEARKVQGSKELSDDLEFALKLVQHAEKLVDDPSGQALFYIKAYEFSPPDPMGYSTALLAMSKLAKDQPKRKPYADEKMLEVYQRRYEAGVKIKLQPKNHTEEYVDKLLGVAEHKLQQGDVQAALALSTTASELVKLHSVRRNEMQALAAKVKGRQELVAKLDKLREQLERQPQNYPLRLQVVTMLIVEFNQLNSAATYLDAQPDLKDFSIVKLALKESTELTEAELVALAEWYKAQSSRASAFAKPSMLHRAIACYERFLQVHRTKDTQRLKAEVALAETIKLLPKDLKPPKLVNLLPMIDTQRDAVRGKWIFTNRALVGEGEATLRIPYQPPEEYDFRIEFTRLTGTGAVGQMLSASSTSFSWLMAANHNKDCGFDQIDHKRAWENNTHVSDPNVLENGRRYTSIVRVRKNGVSVEVEGKTLARHETDYSDMSPQWRWDVGRGCLGVGSWEAKTAFHLIEIVEISGEGKPSPKGK